MGECYVSFSSASEVMEFVSIATRQYFPIQLEMDNLRTSATSIMSIFAMGFNRPLRVVIADSNADASLFFSQLAPYLVA